MSLTWATTGSGRNRLTSTGVPWAIATSGYRESAGPTLELLELLLRHPGHRCAPIDIARGAPQCAGEIVQLCCCRVLPFVQRGTHARLGIGPDRLCLRSAHFAEARGAAARVRRLIFRPLPAVPLIGLRIDCHGALLASIQGRLRQHHGANYPALISCRRVPDYSRRATTWKRKPVLISARIGYY